MFSENDIEKMTRVAYEAYEETMNEDRKIDFAVSGFETLSNKKKEAWKNAVRSVTEIISQDVKVDLYG